MVMFSACNVSNVDPNSVEFYKDNGYFEIKTNSYLKPMLNGTDHVIIDDTILVKNGTDLTFSYNSSLTEVALKIDNSLINFEENSYLVGFNVNGVFYDYNEIESATFHVNCDYLIEPVIKSFDIVGVALYFISEYNENSNTYINDETYKSQIYYTENGEFVTTDNFLFYAYFASCDDISNLSNKNITSNIMTNVSTSNSDLPDKFDISLSFELPIESTEVFASLIILNEDNMFDLINTKNIKIDNSKEVQKFSFNNLSSDSFEVNTINVELINNLSYSDFYGI